MCGKSHIILLLVICFWYAVGYFAYLYCNNVDHGNKRVSSSNYWLSIWPFYIMFLNICNDINIYRSFGLICMAWIWLTFFYWLYHPNVVFFTSRVPIDPFPTTWSQYLTLGWLGLRWYSGRSLETLQGADSWSLWFRRSSCVPSIVQLPVENKTLD